MIGIRSAFSIRARGHRPHLEAVYMTAPRSVRRNTKKALPTGGRPYMTTSTGIHQRQHTHPRSRGANASEVCENFPPFPWEGRGECRVPTHPQPRMQSKKAYELVTTGKPDDPAFPHAMVLTFSSVISPVIGFVSPSSCASERKT